MAFSQIATSVTIINSGLKGYQAVSLTNFTVSAESAIADGSAVEIANAFFLASGDVSASGFSAITTGNTCYIALTPSGTAGSQLLTAAWTETAPTWRDDAQGWYASAASAVRYVAGTTKTGTSSAEPDFILANTQGSSGTSVLHANIDGTADGIASTSSGNPELKVTMLSTGDWNMDTTVSVSVAHGLTASNIRMMTVKIRNDANTVFSHLAMIYPNGAEGIWWDTTNVNVYRNTGGFYDSNPDYDGTGFSRGTITIWYEV